MRCTGQPQARHPSRETQSCFFIAHVGQAVVRSPGTHNALRDWSSMPSTSGPYTISSQLNPSHVPWFMRWINERIVRQARPFEKYELHRIFHSCSEAGCPETNTTRLYPQRAMARKPMSEGDVLDLIAQEIVQAEIRPQSQNIYQWFSSFCAT